MNFHFKVTLEDKPYNKLCYITTLRMKESFQEVNRKQKLYKQVTRKVLNDINNYMEV